VSGVKLARTSLLVIGVVALVPGVAVAQRVVDGTTGKPIRGATVSTDGDTVLATTDADGRFPVPVVDPATTLIVMATGFEAALIVAAEAEGAEIVLLPEGMASEVIEVEGEAPPATPGATRLDRDEVEHLPGAGGDLIASLDALPGITGGPAARGFSGVVIRGSAPEDSRILVDGFEIPLLYHIGLRSIIPTTAIAGLDYLPGGFDVAYGRASSGIVAVTTRGGSDHAGGQAETSVIDGGVLGQGPIGKRGNVLVAVRRSVVDLLLPTLIPDDADIQLTTVPRYWDGQLRIDHELTDHWNGTVSAIGTSDVVELIADDEDDPDQRFRAQTSFVRVIADARHHDGPWSTQLAVSPIVQRVAFEIGRDVHWRADQVGVTARGETSRTWSEALGLRAVVARAGAEAVVTRWHLDLAAPAFEDEGEPEMENGPPTDPTTFFDDAIWVTDLAGWTAVSAGLGPAIRLTTGLRVDGFARTRDVTFQPRSELAIAASDTTKLRLVAGAYRRPAEYVTELLDRDLDPERATQTIAGVEHTPIEGLTVQTSLYYTDRTQLLTRADDGGFDNLGRGTTYGAETMVTVKRGGWFGFVSYALSRSTRVDRPGAERRLFDQDQTHDLNVAASWKHGGWQLGARFQYTSGTPTTEVVGAIYDSDRDQYVPAHHQLDVRVDRSWYAGPMKLTAFLDVANVYLNAPIVGYQYNFDYSEQQRFEGLPILPSIGMRGEL